MQSVRDFDQKKNVTEREGGLGATIKQQERNGYLMITNFLMITTIIITIKTKSIPVKTIGRHTYTAAGRQAAAPPTLQAQGQESHTMVLGAANTIAGPSV